jgi:large subunit ribosomal protein L31e
MAEENKIVLEREYVVPLRDAFRETAFYRKTPKAVKALKIFIAKHMKVEERNTDKVKLDKFLNEQMWFRGIRYPPARIKVKAKKYSNGIVTVELSEMPQALKFKAESEKRRAEAKPEKKPEEKPKEEAKPTEEKKAEKEKEESGAAQEIKATKQEAKQFKHEVAEKHQIKQPLRVSSLRK